MLTLLVEKAMSVSSVLIGSIPIGTTRVLSFVKGNTRFKSLFDAWETEIILTTLRSRKEFINFEN
jgi:hypothetical protein